VTLTNPYYMGRTEVTQAQWNAVMPFNYSRFPGNPDRPIEDVAWLAAKDFCQRTGLRLPSEAEWEHACRAGSSTPRYGPVNDISWHSGNIGISTPRPVALKLPNGFGLYDMLGNVWEVMEDWAGAYTSAAVTNPTGPASGNFRIFRGGSRLDSALWMRTSSRLESPMATIGHCGFRVARNP
jgi:formylglycine-generating enzyme required for sulfatase activity